MKKLLLLLPVLALTLLFSPVAKADDHHHRRDRGRAYGYHGGKRNLNDGYDRYYNRRRGYERREYLGRRRYYRDGRYYYRSGDDYYPYGYRRSRPGVSISF